MNLNTDERPRECFPNILMTVNEIKSLKFIVNCIIEQKMQVVITFTIVSAMVRDNQHAQTTRPPAFFASDHQQQ